MAIIINKLTGEKREVSHEQLVDLYRSDAAMNYEVQDPNVQRQIDEFQQFSSLDQQALAAGEAFLGEASLGLLRPENFSEDAAKRKEHALAGRWAGGITGAVAPALLSGGGSGAVQGGAKAVGLGGKILQAGRTAATLTPAGALARGGSIIERQVAGKLASSSPLVRKALSMGTAGAVEGAGAGASYAGSDEYARSGDLSKAAQAALAGGVFGGVTGGITGGAFGGVTSIGAPRASTKNILKTIDDIEPGASNRLAQRLQSDVQILTKEIQDNPGSITAVQKAMSIYEDMAAEAISGTKKLSDVEISNLKLQKRQLQTALEEATDEAKIQKLNSSINDVNDVIDGGVKHTSLTSETAISKYKKLQEAIQDPEFKTSISDEAYNSIKKNIDDSVNEIVDLGDRALKSINDGKILGSRALKELQQEQFFKSIGGNQTGLDALRKANPGMSDDQIYNNLSSTLESLKTEDGHGLLTPRGTIPATVDEILPGIQYNKAVIGNRLDDTIGSVDKWIKSNSPTSTVNIDGFLSKIDDEVQAAKLAPDSRNINPFAKEFEKLKDRNLSIGELWDFRQKLDAKFTRSGKVGYFDPRYVDLRNEFDNTILSGVDDLITKTPSLTKELGDQSVAELSRKYKAINEVEQLASYGDLRSKGNNFFGLTDNIQGAAAGSVSALGSLLTSNKGATGLGGLALAYQIGSGDFDMESLATAGAIGLGARYGGQLFNRAINKRASSAIYRSLKALEGQPVKISNLTKKSVFSPGIRPAATIGTQSALNVFNTKKNESEQQALSRFKTKQEGKIAAYDAVIDDPNSTDFQKSVAEVQRRKAEHLRAVAPGDTITDPLQPHIKKDIPPTDVDVEKYKDRVLIAEKPFSIYDKIENGSLTPEMVITLAEVYPDLYEDMRSEMFEQLRSSDQIPESRRPAVETFLGVMESNPNIGAYQEAHQTEQTQAAQPKPLASTTDGLVSNTKQRFSLA